MLRICNIIGATYHCTNEFNAFFEPSLTKPAPSTKCTCTMKTVV